MRTRRWILILAAVLMLSACSGGNTPVATAPSRSGETLPNKPSAEAQTSGVPLSTKAAETTQPATEAPETSPVQTEPESTGPETTAEPETEPGTEPFVMPDFYTGKTYSVSKYWYSDEEGDDYVMDAEGHLLDADRIPLPIVDELTGEVKFYDRTEYIKTGPNYEDVKVSTTLYDRDGNILEEDVPYLFYNACGNCVTRLSSNAALMYEGQFTDYTCELYDPYAHKVVRDDVYSLIKLTDGKALAMDRQGVLLGVVDASGAVLAGFPMETGPYRWPYVYGNGFVFADVEDEADGGLARVLLNSELEYVDYASSYENYRVFKCGERGEILTKVLETGETYVFDMDKWEILLRMDDTIEEMDSRRIICSRNDRKWLYDWNGKQLAGPYEELAPIREAEGEDYTGFAGRNGTVLYLLDADGKILKQRDVPNLYYVSVFDGMIYCATSEYDAEIDYYDYGVFICDYQLNQLIPEGYSSVRLVAPGVYACPRYNAQNEIRLTLFNDKGEVIFENATCVGYGDEDAIPVVKGFTVGLIDRQGSWIAKNSKYTQETDD